MQIPLILDPSGDQSLTSQLVGQLRDAITRGRIARGTKLPSSRRLSEQLGVSRNTVVRAYEELCSEGYVEARPASCVAVAACLPDSMAVPTDAAPGLHHHDGDESVEMPMPALQPRCQDLVNRSRNRLSFDFFPGRPNAGLFPIKTWRRLLQNCLSHGGAVGLSQYGDPAGSIALRTAIAGHLAVTRGIVAEASRIMVVNGIQEGINIAARLFLGPGTAAVSRKSQLPGRRLRLCGRRRRDHQRAGRRPRTYDRGPSVPPRCARLCDAVASISDRAHAGGAAPRAPDRLGAAQRLLPRGGRLRL